MSKSLQLHNNFNDTKKMVINNNNDKEEIISNSLYIGIPFGKKCNLCITFENKNTIMLLLEKKNNIIIHKYNNIIFNTRNKWEYGTLFYGTLTYNKLKNELNKNNILECRNDNSDINETYETELIYVIEDIITYKGISVINRLFIDKLIFILEFMNDNKNNKLKIKIANINLNINELFSYKTYAIKELNIKDDKIDNIIDNIIDNSFLQKEEEIKPINSSIIIKKNNKYKPQYKLPTIFKVKARIDEDIYELYAYGIDKKPIFYGIAGINDYKTSIMMNSIFRNFRENLNIDYIEMSDDEDDNLQNYTNLEKMILIECIYNIKFNKWIPIKIASGKLFISIVKL